MLADEIAQAQARAAIQAEARNSRHEARSQSQPTSHYTSSSAQSHNSRSITTMEDHQYSKIIDSIPIFSGHPHENINDWLDIVSLKFDIIGYDPRQKRRFIPQYLVGNALKWHLAHRDELSSWDDYLVSIKSAFPRLITTSRDMNLKLLRDRKQGDTESFIDYYTVVIDLCHKHVADMDDNQIIDWLKAGMKITLYEKLQGEEFDTPQALLLRAQRIELNNAVLDARKDEYIINPTVLSTSSSVRSDHNTRWDQPSNSPISSTQYPTSSYPPLLLPTGSELRVPPLSNPNGPRYSFSSQSTSYPSRGPPTNNRSARHHRPIICYSCNQPGHISPHCPYRPKE